MKSLHLLTTGGTIDSVWDGTVDTAVPSPETILLKLLKNAKLNVGITHTAICAKDSREINDDDRKLLLEAIHHSPHQYILISHGTYTMPDTADYLSKNLQDSEKTVILTGSMIPVDGFTFSDGPFNLGYAVAKLQDSKPGVYVAMNGELFDGSKVIKLKTLGQFVSLYGA